MHVHHGRIGLVYQFIVLNHDGWNRMFSKFAADNNG